MLLAWLLAGCGLTDVVGETDTRPDVLLVVMDTVRADHVGFCGAEPSLTPTLDALAANGTATCEGVSPGAWTLPTHAAWFTGVALPEHHYDSAKVPDWSGRTLLAEHMSEAGYRTALVTANPVLTRADQLARGFDVVRSADKMGQVRGKAFARLLDPALDALADRAPTTAPGLDPEPWFVVVNLMDAHDPWRGVRDHEHLPDRRRLDLAPQDPEGPYQRFARGLLDDAERKAFLAHLRDVYAAGVERADHALEATLDAWFERRSEQRQLQVVVTSDHGEHLGEHGRLRHGGWTDPELIRVPLVATSPDATAFGDGPVSTLAVHDLVRFGRVSTPHAPVAYSSPSSDPHAPGSRSVAWVGETGTLRWLDGDVHVEEDGVRRPPTPEETTLLAPHVAAYEAHETWRREHDRLLSDRAALRALGYTTPDEEAEE